MSDVSDEELIAYLDGAPNNVLTEARRAEIVRALADPDVAARVEELRMDTTELRSGMDALLGTAPTFEIPDQRDAQRRSWPQIAAVAAVFVVGVLAGWLLSPGERDDWHMAVAEYQVLYTTETLTAVPATSDQRAAGLAATGKALGLDLTPAADLPGLQFKRAQLLRHDGNLVAQLVYLDGDGNPVAFCLTRTGGADAAKETLTRKGLTATAWQTTGVGFLLIGPVDQGVLAKAQVALSKDLKI